MDTLLQVASVSKRFPVTVKGAPRGSGHFLQAVDDVSFSLGRGECVGLVGESGCGKSTLVKLITRLLDTSDGRIWFDGQDIGTVPADRFARMPQRALIQMVFQDPTDSLNPRFTAFDTIADPIRRLGRSSGAAEVTERVSALADMVGLPRELLGRYPHQLSGGQKQRVGIARAVALEPRLLVLDEPTSALDVSVQAVILKLLEDLRRRLGMSYLFVSHDLNVVRLLADRVLVMYLGRIVEMGPVSEVFERPRHPYTRALLSCVPEPGGAAAGRRIRLSGEPRSPIDPDPNVCRFYGRCPEGHERCTQEMPLLHQVGRDHVAACHLVAGLTTLAGSKINAGHPPAARDATVVARLRGAGAVLLGALNMDEYAFGFTTYVCAQRFRAWYRERVREVFRDVDVLLAPTTPFPAPRIGQETIAVAGLQVPMRPMLGLYTQPLSFVGLPVISVPVAGSTTLPLGVQLVAAPWNEAALFRIAAVLERDGILHSDTAPTTRH